MKRAALIATTLLLFACREKQLTPAHAEALIKVRERFPIQKTAQVKVGQTTSDAARPFVVSVSGDAMVVRTCQLDFGAVTGITGDADTVSVAYTVVPKNVTPFANAQPNDCMQQTRQARFRRFADGWRMQ